MTDVGQLIVGSDMACKMMILALYAPSRQRRLITSLLVAPFPEKFGSDSSTSSVGGIWAPNVQHHNLVDWWGSARKNVHKDQR